MSSTKYVSFADLYRVEKEKDNLHLLTNHKQPHRNGQNIIETTTTTLHTKRRGDRHTRDRKQLNVRIDNETLDRIKAFCEKEGISIQRFVEIISEHYILYS
jgi:predicted DNA binding CopG/RHH family protein